MRTSALLGLMLAISVIAFAQQKTPPAGHSVARPDDVQAPKYQPLNVKPGLWEVSYTQNSQGTMPIPPEALAKMSPEQLARLQARMKEHMAEQATTHTYKSCVKKEDLEKGKMFEDSSNGCKQTILNSTSTNAAVKMVCQEQGMQGQGTLEITALDSENTKGTSHITVSGNGNTFHVDAKMTGKWVSSNCGSVD